MANNADDSKREPLESEVQDLHLKEEDSDTEMDNITVAVKAETPASAGASSANTPTLPSNKRPPRSPIKMPQSAIQSPTVKSDLEQIIGGDVTIKQEPGKPPKLSRTTSRKVERRPPPLLSHWEDKTAEATSSFDVLTECIYSNKHLGSTDPALECDCAEEWDSSAGYNNACGEDSDCINRATKMECCARDCGCGNACQNQRFTRKQYAGVSVIKTEKKGYGLRADKDLSANDFIFEYIGEVIGEANFRKRMQLYDEQGIKHFYFMSLTKGEFVDATRRGNLGRFCNHSCNPNCYVDKWVVGDKLRMGIFAERKIKAGEELVFNYNVDRYGAEPQPCYCGEPNCTGFIGGKTQTERATKLSKATIEALGIDDADAWDTAVAKKPRKKKTGEDDEEYVNNVEPRELDETGVRSVMAQLPQCKEKWIAVKLLGRIQRAEDPSVINQVVKMHGYRHLKTALGHFMDDVNICLQILDVLNRLPRITRNKIQDSKIEDAVQLLTSNEDERVATQAKTLLEVWTKLEIGYRIPRVKRDPNATIPDRKIDRRDNDRRRSRSRSRTRSPERVHAPTGPRGNAAPRKVHPGPRPPPRFRPPPPSGPLPAGWFEAVAANGSTYYYNQAGNTSWQRPTIPAAPAPPPPPPKAISDQQMLQDLIKNIVAAKKEPAKLQSETATPTDTPKREKREDKWRSLPEDKQKKMYESTIQPHVMHVVNKFKHKMEKDDLKRLAKEASKKIVNTDFKSKRVDNPSKISEKHAKSVKKYAQQTFDRAIKKKADHEKIKVEKSAKGDESRTSVGSPPATGASPTKDEDEPILSDDDGPDEPEATLAETDDSSAAFKRPREEDLLEGVTDEAALKRLRIEIESAAQPPPPPPPPPTEPPLDDVMDMMAPEGAANGHHAGPDDVHSVKSSVDVPATAAASMSTANDQATSVSASEPTQTATPPTTGSPDQEGTEQAVQRQNFAGMSADRMRLLGLSDGASE